MKNIKLNNEIDIDLPKLIDSRLLIQANSGAGKSWAIRRILEQSHGKVQQIVIDLEGEFGTLREKYDFILAGKGGDTPATPQSAALLARKLLELNVSAIIDLYELPHQDRKRFVRLFLEAMVNAPKELWHPVLVIIDEAHVFVPEKGESEAAGAVIDLATRGRKRGYCAVLATQRISKLHKDAAAECNNKLIGRSSQDIDMKRAADELGFTSREQQHSLRKLEAGEFFAFGPAISDEVIKLRVGDIHTSHPKAGSRALTEVASPSSAIKKILGKLADLPAEAQQEAKTIDELKAEIRTLRRAQTPQKEGVSGGFDQKFVDNAVKSAILTHDRGWVKYMTAWEKLGEDYVKAIKHLSMSTLAFKIPKKLPALKSVPTVRYGVDIGQIGGDKTVITTAHHEMDGRIEIKNIEYHDVPEKFGKCSKMIYSFLMIDPLNKEYTKTQVAVAVGYSQNSGGFNNSVSELSAAGLIEKRNGWLRGILSRHNRDLIIPIDKSLEKWLLKLGACSRKIWELMLTNTETNWSKDKIASDTGYSVTSGGFNNSISELSALGLIERVSGSMVRVNPEILNL